MNYKYKNVKKLDFKKWLLGGNSKIYAFILLVTIAAIIVVLGTAGTGSGTDSDVNEESTADVTSETVGGETYADSTESQQILPHERYKIRINKASNFVTVYTMDSQGHYTVVDRQFRCSVNTNIATQTSSIAYKYTWVVFGRNTCARFISKLSSGISLHSTLYYNENVYMANKTSYNNLGKSTDVGYICLSVADIKWIYENCSIDTVVEVYEDAGEISPFASIKYEQATTKYEPTDIEAANSYVPETKAPETKPQESQTESNTLTATETMSETVSTHN